MLEYLSYCFHFQTVLTGPLCFYTDFQRFISGENVIVKGKRVATPWKTAAEKIIVSIFCCVLIVVGEPRLRLEIISQKTKLGVIQWSLLFFFVMSIQRIK